MPSLVLLGKGWDKQDYLISAEHHASVNNLLLNVMKKEKSFSVNLRYGWFVLQHI